MQFEDDDTRKVQTAVIGRADSDWPVFLPYDHDDFDLFMDGRSRDDFYCGVLLGGCGRKLTAKRYTEKKCHFAHRPPVHCRRTETGETSADHLYIGQALRRRLEQQGYRNIDVAYLDPGSVHGGAVEVRFGQGLSRLIRVQLARLSPREWEETRECLADGHTHVHWVYGPYCGLAHNEVEATGHAVRVSCRTEGGTREVYVGTQYADSSLAWSALAECHVADEGIITPRLHVEPPAAALPSPTAVAFPLAAGTIAFTAVTELPAPGAGPDGTAVRLYEADLQPIGSAAVRARISLPRTHPVPGPDRLHVIYTSARLLPLAATAPSEPAWLVRADGALPLTQRTDPRWPDLHPAPSTPVPPPRPPTTTSEPATPASRPVALPRSEAETVRVLRAKLEQVARARDLITWTALVRHAGAAPEDLTPEDRVRLLIAVDHPRADHKPVLSALVHTSRAPSAPTPYFGAVLAGLGWRADLTRAKVAEIWERERRTAYSLAEPAPARQQPQAVPPEAKAGTARARNDAQLVALMREHLETIAKGNGVITWSTLLQRFQVSPSTLSDTDRVRLLAAVDRPFFPRGRMLSALVKTDGRTPGPAPFFGAVLRELGWKRDAATPTVEAAWQAAIARTYRQQAALTEKDHRYWDKLGTTKEAVITAVREALVDAARRQVRVGWHTLSAAAGLDPSDLNDRVREDILVAIDSSPTHDVLLSSLVISWENTPVPYLNSILKRLGKPHDLRPIELGRFRKTEQARAFAAYSAAADTADAPKERT